MDAEPTNKPPLERRPQVLWLLVIANGLVLAGQLWPAGAPPFARIVNIAFLVSTLAFFAGLLRRR
jgi:hypothetical protein